jgi:renal tumor antigen
MEINFPAKHGTGIDRLMPGIPKDCVELIKSMLIYDPEERTTASAAIRHEYFKELYD